MATAMESETKLTELLFCEGKYFCGFDIRPELTSNLTFLSAKNCEILVQNINNCEGLQHELENNGECESCWKTTLETPVKSAQRNCRDTKQAKKAQVNTGCMTQNRYGEGRELSLKILFLHFGFLYVIYYVSMLSMSSGFQGGQKLGLLY